MKNLLHRYHELNAFSSWLLFFGIFFCIALNVATIYLLLTGNDIRSQYLADTTGFLAQRIIVGSVIIAVLWDLTAGHKKSGE